MDPDGGNGTAEWLAVALLGVAAILAFALARRDRYAARSARQVAMAAADPGEGDGRA